MQGNGAPMPPPIATRATSAEIATLQAWISAGYPQGTCDLPPNAGNPYGGASVCSTNAHWQGADHGSTLMHPGGACISCHTKDNGPAFYIGGTVYKTAHEPDDCNGINGAVGYNVVVTDAAGQTVTAAVNAAGNFYWDQTSLKMPIRVKVTGPKGAERAMASTPATGDCNSCHSQAGTKDAPGRIVAP
jgi:hypothetical protein